jgi:hypothetical protein
MHAIRGYTLPMTRFGSWYRRYYLLINVPALLIITEIILARWRLIEHEPFNAENDLAEAFARFRADPPGDEPAVILLGNSSMRVGIEQGTLERGLRAAGRRMHVYNFALNSVRVDDEQELVSLLLARGVKPHAVVLGVNPYLIDDQINQDTIYPWLKRSSPYLYFHRSRIRKALRTSFSLWRHHRKPPPYAQFVEGVQTPKERRAWIGIYLSQWIHRAPSDYPLIRQLPMLIRFLQDHGIACYVVLLPMNPVFTHVNPAYQPVMAAIRAQLPAGTLDVADAYPDEDFKDTGHLNAVGRARLSAEVLAWLTARKDL